jgi:hypothetical protein
MATKCLAPSHFQLQLAGGLCRDLRLEERHRACSGYAKKIQHGGGINDLQRDAAVSWLLALVSHMKFPEDTLFLSINLLDRFLSTVKVTSKHLQLVTVACFMLACKVLEEEELQPSFKELIRGANYAFSALDLVRMEKIIGRKLNWELWTVTSWDFLHRFCGQFIEVPRDLQIKLLKKGTSILKHTALYDFLRYPPSLQALCAIKIAAKLLVPEQDFVTLEALQTASSHDPRLEIDCCTDMQFVLSEIAL